MAKKKSDTASSEKTPTPAKKSAPTTAAGAAKKPAASAGSKSAAPAAGASPTIDTSLAANAAAAMIANKAGGAAGVTKQPQQKKESSAFKQLKAGLNKPAAGALGGAFGVAGPRQKKSAQNYGGGKQVGHNQTFGSDVNRAGVPRRTPG